MNAFMQLSEGARAGIVFVISLVIAGQVNHGIYRLAWNARAIGPWSRPPADAPPRTWFDYLPVLGWFMLRREEPMHGAGFWVRPAMIELLLAAGLAALYVFEMRHGLLPFGPFVPPGVVVPAAVQMHQMFFAHAVLVILMTVATFIDLDEKTIPDSITAPGAMFALILAALWPAIRLPVLQQEAFPPKIFVDFMHLASPLDWPKSLEGRTGLILGVGALLGWCWAMVPTTCTLRRGWWNGVRFYLASFFRGSYWRWMAATAVVGGGGIAWVWSQGGEHWKSLLSQLVGLFFGGLLVWSVRITAGIALRKEAMGFGDVTLMAMIGAFLGWQATLIIFFLSPAAALFVSLTQWATTGRRDIAFGPYLCLSALFLIVCWPLVQERTEGVFYLGWIVPGLFAACLFMMMGLLMLWRIAEEAFFSGDSKSTNAEKER